jgi:multidrug efflux pump subunit AcrA (membrane-fusion protein)
MRIRLLVPLLALAILGPPPAPAQVVAGSSTTTEQQRILDLKKLELTLQHARTRYDRAKKLFEAKLNTAIDLNQAEVEFRQAEVNFQQASVQLFSDVPRLSFVSAVKTQAPNGRKYVLLTIRNTSGAVMDYQSFGIDLSQVPVPDQLKLRELSNISVSLRDYVATGAGPIISNPYEAIVPALSEIGKRPIPASPVRSFRSPAARRSGYRRGVAARSRGPARNNRGPRPVAARPGGFPATDAHS